MRKTYWISIKRLKIHEFDTTLRLLNPEDRTWARKSATLSDIEKKSLKNLLQNSGQVLVAYLIASSLRAGNDISLKVANFEASVPAAYFLCAASFLLVAFAMNLNHYSVIFSIRSRLAGRMLLHGFGINAYDTLGSGPINLLEAPQAA